MRNLCMSKLFWLFPFILLNVIKPSEQAAYTCNATALCGCSSTTTATLSRIVGGENAASATWGWAVQLTIGGALCGGSIISSSWVITAAHCVKGKKASQVTVYAGSINSGYYTQRSGASCVVMHPSYDTSTLENDIALIKLVNPFSMTDPQISKICLPTVSSATLSAGEWPAVGTTVVAVGWGRLTENGGLPTRLQQVTLQTIRYNDATCTTMRNRYVQLCAGVSGGGKDTCQGDSGGPLMMFTSGQWILVGLTSNGNGCARPNDAGAYTRVAAFQDWINSTTSAQYCHSTSIYQLSNFILLLLSVCTLFLKSIWKL